MYLELESFREIIKAGKVCFNLLWRSNVFGTFNLPEYEPKTWLVSISFGDLMYLEHFPEYLNQYRDNVSISFGDLMYLEQ